jgi:hypothetical protein
MTTISSTSTGLPTGIITPTTTPNPVASSTTLSGLSSTAAKLGQDSSVIATLGGNTSSTPLYNAVGLLNSIVQAGSTANTQQNNNSKNGGTTSTTTGAGTSTGSSASTTNVNSNWATLLKSHPALASTVTRDSADQAILSTISTSA